MGKAATAIELTAGERSELEVWLAGVGRRKAWFIWRAAAGCSADAATREYSP